jgi:NCAIR mutase (PurE)-related protein
MRAVDDLRIDTERHARTGIAEAIYAPGKSDRQLLEAAAELLGSPGGAVLATRCDDAQLDALAEAYPEAMLDRVGRVAVLRAVDEAPLGIVAVVSAGTSDLPVAQEAATCAAGLGAKIELLVDRGVAGLHRTIDAASQLHDVDVVIAVAGMEGALPSILGGLVTAPIVAVPTSVGYGASLGGVTALLAMLASCAPGIAVVGIDNGFGAAVHAIKILRSRR